MSDEKFREKLYELNRFTQTGFLGALVSHELNNLLTRVLGYAELALMQGTQDQMERSLGIIVESSKQIRDIVDSYQVFASRRGSRIESVDIQYVINKVLVLLKNDFNKCLIKVETEFKTELPHIICNYVGISQVFLNLLTNARDAIYQNGGVIKISGRLKEDNVIEIRIADTGEGIPHDITSSLFDPFVSGKDIPPEKQISAGVGVGLSISKKIILGMGGEILIESNGKSGTTSVVNLPVTYLDENE